MTPLATSSSQGLNLIDEQGKTFTDLTAGRSSCLGHRHPAVCKAIQAACETHLGAAADRLDIDWHQGLGEPFAGFARCELAASANEANEWALRLARAALGRDRYRVITLLGSDHGDTYLLRSASGRTQRQGLDGPVAPGFRHVAPAKVDAIVKAIDAQTAAVCLSPVDWNRGGEALDAEYLVAVESLCRERDLLLIIDETRIPPGAGGSWFFHQRAKVTPDIVTASAGWTGGLPGGLTLVSSRVSDRLDALEGEDRESLWPPPRDFALLRQVITATAASVTDEQWLQRLDETADAWAAMLDEAIAGFDFVRGCTSAGLWTTIEFDLPAADVVNRSRAAGLCLEATGDTTVLICPPVNVTGDTLFEAIQSLRNALESIERETASP
ncbi:MAG: aminotransferase class III-fold pyridoxal phosphate-dependent enzyme [Planctomycetaceae bacterium]